MKDIDLELLLRYVLSGGFFATCFIFSFFSFWKIELLILLNQSSLAIIIPASGFLAIMVGALIYSTSRAVIFPIFLIFTQVASGRILLKEVHREFFSHQGKGPSFDVEKWNRIRDEKSAQRHLSEWGAQIHFLFNSGISGLLALGLGTQLGLGKSNLYCVFLGVSLGLIFAATVSCYRYQFREIAMK